MASGSKFDQRAFALSLQEGRDHRKDQPLSWANFIAAIKPLLHAHDIDLAPFTTYFFTYLDLVKAQLKNPFLFQPFHRRVLHPCRLL